MKKYYLSLFVIVLFSIGFVSSSEDDDKAANFVGEYVVKDTKGTTWYFNFKLGNELIVRTDGMKDDDVFYGKWWAYEDYYDIDFIDFHAGNPMIYFPNGFIGARGEYMKISNDGWLYKNEDYMKSKNAQARLKIEKRK